MSTESRDQNKPELSETFYSLARPGGTLPVFRVGPDDDKQYPAIILVHEIFGLNEHIKDVARRFARTNLVVYAPDLFAYNPALPADQNDLAAMRNVWASITDEQLISDMHAVFSLARSSEHVRPNAIGALGYCMGGAIAYMFACRTPLLAWVVDYYGRIYYQNITEQKPRHPIDYTGGLNCPLLGLFAGLDDLITADHIKQFEKKMADLGKSFQIKVYPSAKHAFFNDTREFYHSEAANDAWHLTLSFIRENSRELAIK
ncbi:MAG: dienelactone hydrolase family protein [Candidatus Obscuribacterales bacterium]|jgi:carboxymethylenebutenolidase|nr:dienelactone hydrolase family protein [Candidatus Obscuribacterales bacterium]